jgi:acyl carrier protein
MSVVNRKQLTNLIVQWVRENTQSDGFSDPEITEDTDLMASGLLDSFGFIDLLLFVESQSGIKVDLTDVDPSEFTVIKGLCNIALARPIDDRLQAIGVSRTSNLQQLPG